MVNSLLITIGDLNDDHHDEKEKEKEKAKNDNDDDNN